MKILKLRISILDIKPSIYREVLVPINMNFQDLHYLIQQAFGWDDIHLYDFNYNRKRICASNVETMDEPLDAEETTLMDLEISKGKKITYEYDFGDSWEHLIKVEDVLDDDGSTKYPICIGGARACPPEDVGGVDGYKEMIKILKRPNTEEYDDLIDWLGYEYDPNEFSLEEANDRIEDEFGDI